MNNIMDGLRVSLDIKNKIKEQIEKEGITPHLVVIQIGDNKASNVYIKNKKKACFDVGISFDHIKFNETISEQLVIDEIKRLNNLTSNLLSVGQVLQIP